MLRPTNTVVRQTADGLHEFGELAMVVSSADATVGS